MSEVPMHRSEPVFEARGLLEHSSPGAKVTKKRKKTAGPAKPDVIRQRATTVSRCKWLKNSPGRWFKFRNLHVSAPKWLKLQACIFISQNQFI